MKHQLSFTQNSGQCPFGHILNSVCFVIVFIAPHTILSVSPPELNTVINTVFAVFFLIYTFVNLNALPKNFTSKSVSIFAIALVMFCIPRFLIYQKFSFFDILAPLMAVVGYFIVLKKKLRIVVLEVFLISLYVFYTVTFFSKLTNLQDVSIISTRDYYGSSSINSIPIALINTLYIYIVIVFLQKEDKKRKIFFFALINFFFCIVQQSRSGVALSSLIFIYSFYLRFSNKSIRFLGIVSLFLGFLYLSTTAILPNYFDMIGNMNGFRSLEQDVRGNAVMYFFENQTFGSILFGYEPGTEFAYDIYYTFNTFLDFWNHYTLFGLLLLVGYSIYRMRKYKKFYFPLYYFIPFLIYSLVEPRYLPAHWDFFIYLMLFVPAKYDNNKFPVE